MLEAEYGTTNGRLTFTLFIALILHVAVVLGVSFQRPDPAPRAMNLDVTLSSFKSEQAPEEADFIGQENQQGSGTLDEAKMLTTDVHSQFHVNEINDTLLEEQDASAPRPDQARKHIVSRNSPIHITSLSKTLEQQPNELPDGPDQQRLECSIKMASLEAKFDRLRQTYAKKPRVQRLSAASTMRSANAAYVSKWLQRIERIATASYPREARICKDDCRLRLLVSINANGTIHDLSVLKSSGRKVLDDAAKRAVRAAAPFAPFTQEMKQSTDRLEIIRTWTFQGDRYLSGANR